LPCRGDGGRSIHYRARPLPSDGKNPFSRRKPCKRTNEPAVIHRSSCSLPSSDDTPRGVRRVPPYRPFRSACIGQENPRWTAPAHQGHVEGGTAIGTQQKPWTRTNEPAVVHRSSFGEDIEGTLGSFDMSFDIEVCVEANIK